MQRLEGLQSQSAILKFIHYLLFSLSSIFFANISFWVWVFEDAASVTYPHGTTNIPTLPRKNGNMGIFPVNSIL